MGPLTEHRICASCGAGVAAPEGAPCPACGVPLGQRPLGPPTPGRCPACGSTVSWAREGICQSCGLSRHGVPPATASPEPQPPPDAVQPVPPSRERRIALGVLAVLTATLLVVASWARWGPADDQEPLWRLDLGSPAVGRPVVDDGVAYVTTVVGTVVAVGLEEGAPRWRFETGQRAVGEPVADGGLVHVATTPSGDGGGHLFTIDARTGEERWRVATGSPLTAPPALEGGTLFVVADDVVALDAVTGEERWRRPSPGADTGTALAGEAVAGAGVVIVVTDGGLSALDAVNGESRWEWSAVLRPEVAPAIVGQSVVTADGGGSVVAVDLVDGKERWRVATGGLLRQTPAVAAAGPVVVATADGVLALDPVAGEERWRAGPAAEQHLRVATDGVVAAVVAADLATLDAHTGESLRSARLSPSVRPSGPVVTDSQVLLATGAVLELWPAP